MSRRLTLSQRVAPVGGAWLVAGALLIGCGSSTTASPRPSSETTNDDSLLQSAVDRLVDGEGGDQLDRECVEAKFAALSDEALRLVNEAAPDSTDPRLGPISLQLLDCLDLAAGVSSIAAGGQPASAAGAVALPNPCDLLSPAELAPVFADLTEGTMSSASSVFGEASLCEWDTENGKSVSLLLYPQADLNAWAATSTDGDGISDGDPIEGVGDRAFVSRGDISFAAGPTLVMLHCFPTFDLDPEALAAIARVVDAKL